MTHRGMIAVIFVFLSIIGVIHGKDGSESEENTQASVTPPPFFQYKVQALNTALYYVLHALQDDLRDSSSEVDISFLIRISIIATKIKAFFGEVDKANSAMLGEMRKTFPEYLLIKMTEQGLSFDEYTSTASPPTA